MAADLLGRAAIADDCVMVQRVQVLAHLQLVTMLASLAEACWQLPSDARIAPVAAYQRWQTIYARLRG